jgi:hypothetical protein
MNYNVPIDYQINPLKRSTTKTLNNYTKSDVIMALLDCLSKSLETDANYWATELFASGFYLPLWDCIFSFYFQSIHCQSPHLIEYLNQKHILWSQIKKLYSNNLKNLCNNQELRNHFCEIITILCLSPKQALKIPIKVANIEVSQNDFRKTQQLITLIAPQLTEDSIIYKQFQELIIRYFSPNFETCLYSINWFVEDFDHIITPFNDFKVPVSIASKVQWLVWKFLLLQKPLSEKRGKQSEGLLEILIDLYINIYRRKDYRTCTYILYFVATMCRCPKQIKWSIPLNLHDPQLISQCAQINQVYRNLQSSHIKISAQSKGKLGTKTSKVQKNQEKFYNDTRNNEFLKMINDPSILKQDLKYQTSPQITKKKTKTKRHFDTYEDLVLELDL